jgi:beta-N-acetylhexosaminidase
MSAKSFRRQAGQLAIAGFAGHAIPADLKALAREFDLGGVIFFARNIESPEQVAELSREARELARDLPLWISVDQEGGRVARLKEPFTRWPPMITLGRSGDEALAERFARALAAELRAVGISMAYAPVLDVLTNPRNPVIGDRSLAERADDVARLGTVIIRTLQAEGIAASGKHFPGHGDTSVDSHFELPVIEHPPERLEAVELIPFKAAIAAGVASIILSDDLEMKAISGRYGLSEATVMAIAAGCDAVLMCADEQEKQAGALEAIIRAVEDGTLSISRAEDALARHRRVKERFLARTSTPLTAAALRTVLGRDEHLAVAAEMHRFA